MQTKNSAPASGGTSLTFSIALLWHTVGHGNSGVDALARANIAILKRAAARAGVEACFTTFGFDQTPAKSGLPAGVEIGPKPRLKPILRGDSPFLRAIKAADLVVDIGEGDSFSDIYGLIRFGFQLGTKLSALAYGKPLVLSPQTIGPFDRRIARILAKSVMDRATLICTRDSMSSEYVRRLGIQAPMAEYMDVAFALPYQPAPKQAGKLRIGINVSGLLYNGGYSGKNELGMKLDYRDFTQKLIVEFLARPGIEVHLISHVRATSGPDDDLPVSLDLAAQFAGCVAVPQFDSASEAKSYLSGMDFVVAGRMHACIGAFSSGVPVVPVAYSRKFNGLFDTLDYPFYVDGKTQGVEEALAVVRDCFDQRDELCERLVCGRALAAQRLSAYEDRLVQIIGDITSHV